MKIIESYRVGPVVIELIDTGTEKILNVVEPPLPEEASILYLELRDYFSRHLELDPTSDEDRWIAAERLGRMEAYGQWKHTIDYYLLRDYSGFGRIDPLIRDPDIEEISVVGGDHVRVIHRSIIGWIRTNIMLEEFDARLLAQRLAIRAGSSVSPLFPLREFNLHGDRVSVVLGGSGVAERTSITIRKLRENWGLNRLIDVHMLPRELAMLLVEVLRSTGMLLIVGAQGTGKTTLLGALLEQLPESMRIVAVEEVPELKLQRGNWISLRSRESYSLDITSEKTRITFRELLRSALRMRADVIAVSEARGEEVRYIFEAAALGSASIATFHSHNIVELERRLRLLGIEEYYLDLIWLVVVTGITRRGRRVLEVYVRGPGTWERLAEWDPNTDDWILEKNMILEERLSRAKVTSI